jgi:hypothetical protein
VGPTTTLEHLTAVLAQLVKETMAVTEDLKVETTLLVVEAEQELLEQMALPKVQVQAERAALVFLTLCLALR